MTLDDARALDNTRAFAVFRLLAMTVSILGNSLILFIVFGNPKIRGKGTNLLFAQLAAADFLIGVGTGIRGVSAIIFDLEGTTTFDRGLCLVLGTPTVLGIHLSQTTMMAIAVDRFLCIQYPFVYRNLESKRFCATRFVLCLVFSLLGTFAPYVTFPSGESSDMCSTGSSIPFWYAVYWMVFSTAFSLSIFALYLVIYILYRRSLSRQRRLTSQRHIFTTISIILAFYCVLCFVPNVILVVRNLSTESSDEYGHVSLIIAVGSALNASVNVFIYGFKHPELKGAITRIARRVFRIACCPRNALSDVSSTITRF